jgi:hypothetical protein
VPKLRSTGTTIVAYMIREKVRRRVRLGNFGLVLAPMTNTPLTAMQAMVSTPSALHCFGSLRSLFEKFQQDTNLISERQNADRDYGNEKTAKAVLNGSPNGKR